MMPDAQEFAMAWIKAWNSHDLERILSHYADDFQVTTPMIKVAMGVETGTLHGKETIRHYWATALEKIPDLHFELVDVTQSIDSLALYYKSVMGKMAIEVMFFNETGQVNRVIAHYT